MYNLSLPKKFINELTHAQHAYSVIFIYGLSLSVNGSVTLSISDLAQKFNLLQTDIINAWQYWQAKMFIHLTFNKNNITITFISDSNHTDDDELQSTDHNKNTPSVLYYNKPTYSPKELEIYKSSYTNIDHIFKVAEKTIGHLLKNDELSTIYSFYDWLRLPIDVIEVLITYCGENGHRNINYIEKVAIDWAKNNIDTTEKAKEYISSFNKNYKEVLKALGQSRRNITPTEIKYIDTWINEYSHNLDAILEACDKTIMNLGKPDFRYTNKILETWCKEGIFTLEDIQSKEAKYKVKTSPKKVGKFSNFTQGLTDYQQLESVDIKLIKDALKGT